MENARRVKFVSRRHCLNELFVCVFFLGKVRGIVNKLAVECTRFDDSGWISVGSVVANFFSYISTENAGFSFAIHNSFPHRRAPFIAPVQNHDQRRWPQDWR